MRGAMPHQTSRLQLLRADHPAGLQQRFAPSAPTRANSSPAQSETNDAPPLREVAGHPCRIATTGAIVEAGGLMEAEAAVVREG